MPFAGSIKQQEVAQHLLSDQTYATVLLALATDEFGSECLDYDPETLRDSLSRLAGSPLPQPNIDRLNALIVALTTDLFYRSPEAFFHIATSLNGRSVNFEVLNPISVLDAAWALTEVLMSDRDRARPEAFSDDVRVSLGVLMQHDGILRAPGLLSIAIAIPEKPDSLLTDATMFAGAFRISQRKTQDIEQELKTRMQELLRQLDTVPLQNRNQKSWGAFRDRLAATLAPPAADQVLTGSGSTTGAVPVSASVPEPVSF